MTSSAQTTTTTVRKFSAAGPCIPLGTVIAETAKTWMVERRDGEIRRIGKNDNRHTEPCELCRDHSGTMYPNGYAD